MSIAKILVPVSGVERDRVTMATAFAVARLFGAHVRVLFVLPDWREAVPYIELPPTPGALLKVLDEARQRSEAISKAARAAFDATTKQEDIRVIERLQKSEDPTASYVVSTGNSVYCVEKEAHFSDLLVLPPLAERDDREMHDAFVRLLLSESARPILLSAHAPPKALGRKVAVAWNGSWASSHALTASLPFLKRAQAVEIISVEPSPFDAYRIEQLRDYLALHGVNGSVRILNQEGAPLGQSLLQAASNSGCDMVVLGGYGHNRFLEAAFGGVTQFFVSHPSLPLLMVH